jgi:hypothetical protein
MLRQQLEHLIRASAAITGCRELIVIGSQAVLGQFPNAPAELLISVEADLFVIDSHGSSDLIDGSIGEASPFHNTFGYYAHGVGPETAILPAGWEGRLIRLQNENTGGAVALCLEIHDLAASKLVAARKKDLDFIRAVLRHNLADPALLRARLNALPIPEAQRQACLARFERLASA